LFFLEPVNRQVPLPSFPPPCRSSRSERDFFSKNEDSFYVPFSDRDPRVTPFLPSLTQVALFLLVAPGDKLSPLFFLFFSLVVRRSPLTSRKNFQPGGSPLPFSFAFCSGSFLFPDGRRLLTFLYSEWCFADLGELSFPLRGPRRCALARQLFFSTWQPLFFLDPDTGEPSGSWKSTHILHPNSPVFFYLGPA